MLNLLRYTKPKQYIEYEVGETSPTSKSVTIFQGDTTIETIDPDYTSPNIFVQPNMSTYTVGLYNIIFKVNELYSDVYTILVLDPISAFNSLLAGLFSNVKNMLNKDNIIATDISNADIYVKVYKAYLRWGYKEEKESLSKRLLTLEGFINLIYDVLGNIGTRNVLTAPEVEVDDGKLFSRLLKWLEQLKKERDDLSSIVSPELIETPEVIQPAVAVEISQVSLTRDKVVIPFHLNTPPESIEGITAVYEDTLLTVTWTPTYIDDFSKYVLTFKNSSEITLLTKTLYDNTKGTFSVELANVSTITLRVEDSMGLSAETTCNV